MRLFFEMLFCFIIPSTISGFFYLSMGAQLRKRNKERARNRNLNLAFFSSWLLWLFCWVPYYRGMSINYGPTKYIDYQNWTKDLAQTSSIFARFESYFNLYKLYFQMLYSHIIVLICIVVLKAFRQWIFNCFIQVLRCLFLKTPSNAKGTSIWQRKVALLGSAMLKAGEFSVMCVFFYSCGSTLSVSCFF